MIRKILMVLGVLICTQQIFAGATKWYDFEIIDGAPVIDIKISGVPAKAALSTGSTTIFVNVDSLDEKGIKYKRGKKVIVSGLYGNPEEDRLVRGVDIEVLGLNFDLDRSGPSYGETPYDVLLGYSFFKPYVFQIDYPNSKIRALTRDSVDLRKIANVKTSSAAQKKGLIITSELDNGEELRLKLSTGLSSGILLNYSFVEQQQGWLDKYPHKVIEDNPSHSVMVLPELKIGPASLSDVTVNFPSEPVKSNIRKKSDGPATGTSIKRKTGYHGLIGYDVLKHFIVTLDAKTGKMHITW